MAMHLQNKVIILHIMEFNAINVLKNGLPMKILLLTIVGSVILICAGCVLMQIKEFKMKFRPNK